MNERVTVLTPTYNREQELRNLYISLLNQSNKKFIWYIIDDGSQDNTEKVVSEFIEKADFCIIYEKKANGGKHTALNIGFQSINTDFTFIVDSDDVLTSDAIQQIYDVASVVMDQDLAGVSFLRGYTPECCIGDQFPKSCVVMNDIDVRIRKKVSGDKAEVWRTDILKRYRFPVFEGERFQGENYVWWQIALEYDMYYVNKIIYITEYLEGGLTRSGRKLRINCPLGGMENSKIGLNENFPLRERCKRAWLYVCYGKFAKKAFKEIVPASGYPAFVLMNYAFGYLLFHYWRLKYQ